MEHFKPHDFRSQQLEVLFPSSQELIFQYIS
jgi:hypothetical protein